MAKASFYAVKTGKAPGIYTTWAECEAQVKGFPGAEYKKFSDEEEAKKFAFPEQEVEEELIPEEEAGPYKFDSSIKIKNGKFVDFRDEASDHYPVAYFEMPYEDNNCKGNLYVREGNGQIFATKEGVDHTYEYGQPVDNICAANLRSRIEAAAGYDFDVIVDAANVNGDKARKEFREKIEPYGINLADHKFEHEPPKQPASGFDKDTAMIYVDGSYNADTKKYGYGVYMTKGDGSDPHIFVGVGDCEANGRNVEGEVAAARVGLFNAKKAGFKDAVVFHDYQGIGSWGDGEWKTNKEYTKRYAAFVDGLRDEGMNIKFTHVDGHTGDVGNEYVDKLAKIACGVPITASERDYIRQLKDVPGYPHDEKQVENTVEMSLSDNGLTF